MSRLTSPEGNLIKCTDCIEKSNCYSSFSCDHITESIAKLREYEELDEQGKLLKNPQELKDAILDRMKEFMDEYRSYSESSIDHFGGKADSMETAMRIVKAAFTDAI